MALEAREREFGGLLRLGSTSIFYVSLKLQLITVARPLINIYAKIWQALAIRKAVENMKQKRFIIYPL
jgi:hypothetical protein